MKTTKLIALLTFIMLLVLQTAFAYHTWGYPHYHAHSYSHYYQDYYGSKYNDYYDEYYRPSYVYRTSYVTPTAGAYRNYERNYDYKVKYYEVRYTPYRYDGYPYTNYRYYGY